MVLKAVVVRVNVYLATAYRESYPPTPNPREIKYINIGESKYLNFVPIYIVTLKLHINSNEERIMLSTLKSKHILLSSIIDKRIRTKVIPTY